jgi:hypothetical protein
MPGWKDIDRGKLLIIPPELSENFTSSRLAPVGKQEEHGKGNAGFCL